jgi:peroxiredoxin Q/BCP
MRSFAFSLLVGLVATSSAAAQAGSGGATQQSAPGGPDVGIVAPDFTITGANAQGARMPVKLSEYRGRVVVLAFYPLDRSSGCTAELTKFRDDFSSLFGDGVIVLPVSVDSVGSHASWAKEMKFPFTLLSDPDQKVAATYGSTMAGRPLDARTVYVIGRDGKVTYRNMKFGALSADAYKDLAAAVAKAKS